jgi:hypothetical protein
MQAVLPIVPYDRDYAIKIIAYYQRRNYHAYRSHRKKKMKELKTWRNMDM